MSYYDRENSALDKRFNSDDYDHRYISAIKLHRKGGGYKQESREGCPYYGDEEMMLKKCKDCIDMNCF